MMVKMMMMVMTVILIAVVIIIVLVITVLLVHACFFARLLTCPMGVPHWGDVAAAMPGDGTSPRADQPGSTVTGLLITFY